MDENFNFLLGKYTTQAADVIKGRIILEQSGPFSVEAMDVSFNFGVSIVQAIRRHCADKGIIIRHVVIMTAFHSDLGRDRTNMSTDTRLIVTQDGEVNNAIYFTGVSLDED